MRLPTRVRSLLFLALLPALAPSVRAQLSGEELLTLQPVLLKAKAQASKSTVTVRTFGGTRKGAKRPKVRPGQRPGRRRPQLGTRGFKHAQGATAGVVVGRDGWILISRNALAYDPTTILVTLPDGRQFTAKRAGEDLSRAIALLKIEADDLVVPEFVPMKDVTVGQWAFVLGKTFGTDADTSVHVGVVSAVNRIFGRAVQVDAYTSPANYGGPVIDVKGRVLGISVPLAASGRQAGEDLYDSGIGFGAAIADIIPLIERMKKGEKLYRGYMGVATDPAHMGPGAKISRVQKKSPAKNARIRKKCMILEVDSVKVKNGFHLQTLVGSKMAGDPVRIKYRNRKKEEIEVTLILEKVGAAQMRPKGKEEETKKLPWEELEDEGGVPEEEDEKEKAEKKPADAKKGADEKRPAGANEKPAASRPTSRRIR